MNAPSDVRLDAPAFELEDNWEAINQWFLDNELTDGLPIVPPTEARVQAMTAYVERELGFKPHDVIGTLAPKHGQATVEKIAANAVMAGCRPEYMPVLMACVKGVAEPKFKDRKSTRLNSSHVSESRMPSSA